MKRKNYFRYYPKVKIWDNLLNRGELTLKRLNRSEYHDARIQKSYRVGGSFEHDEKTYNSHDLFISYEKRKEEKHAALSLTLYASYVTNGVERYSESRDKYYYSEGPSRIEKKFNFTSIDDLCVKLPGCKEFLVKELESIRSEFAKESESKLELGIAEFNQRMIEIEKVKEDILESLTGSERYLIRCEMQQLLEKLDAKKVS